MKVIFFGLGSVGRRHTKLIKTLYPSYKLYAFRSKKNSKKNDLGLEEVYDWQALRRIEPDAAFITNPTFLHVDTALRCASLGINLFIEKPLGSGLKNFPKLLKTISSKRLATYVAYVLRFHPVVNEIKKQVRERRVLHMRVITTSFLPRWRPGVDYRKRYSAHNFMGGGVVYDLSHELDFAQFILGPIQKIEGRFGKAGHVTVDSEDYADILIDAKKGKANIHMDFLSQIPQRVIQVDFKEKSIVGDILNGTVVEYKNGKISSQKKFKGGYDECYRKQLKYFFTNLKNPRMMNNVFEAADLFRKLVSFKKTRQLDG